MTSVAVSVNLPLRAIEDSTGKEGHLWDGVGWPRKTQFFVLLAAPPAWRESGNVRK